MLSMIKVNQCIPQCTAKSSVHPMYNTQAMYPITHCSRNRLVEGGAASVNNISQIVVRTHGNYMKQKEVL